jgi:hypothetical protein
VRISILGSSFATSPVNRLVGPTDPVVPRVSGHSLRRQFAINRLSSPPDQ